MNHLDTELDEVLATESMTALSLVCEGGQSANAI